MVTNDAAAVTAPSAQAFSTAGPGVAVRKDGRYAWYVVVLLTACYAIAFVDRQILNLLVEPIKADFTLTDTRVSLVQGLAFTLAYVAFGPLFGRWIDAGHRRNIIVFGVTVWSIATVFCGLAQSYGQLFAARMAVGGAEACLLPAAWSLLADYFSKEKLPRALSVLLMGPYLGGGFALIFGGLIIQALAGVGTVELFGGLTYAPWNFAFIVVGLPGLLLAALCFSVREPVRGSDAKATGGDKTFTLPEIGAFLWRRRAFYGAFFGGMSLHVIVLYALPSWIPAYLVRAFDMPTADVGLQYGALVLIAGSIGVLSGPYLGRWLTGRGYGDAPFRTAALATLGIVPFALVLPFCSTYVTAMAAIAGVTFFYSLPMAMAASALQMVTPNRMRGFVSSLYVFTVSIVGLGLAPTVIAVITDYVFGDPAKVGWSLAIVCGSAGLLASLLIFRGLAAFRSALAEGGE